MSATSHDIHARIYKEGEVNTKKISQKAEEKFLSRPFGWQMMATCASLEGKDVVLDVDTGSGKSLCFALPLLLSETDITLVVSPLNALMLEQVESSPLKSVAICHETLAATGRSELYKVCEVSFIGKRRRVSWLLYHHSFDAERLPISALPA